MGRFGPQACGRTTPLRQERPGRVLLSNATRQQTSSRGPGQGTGRLQRAGASKYAESIYRGIVRYVPAICRCCPTVGLPLISLQERLPWDQGLAPGMRLLSSDGRRKHLSARLDRTHRIASSTSRRVDPYSLCMSTPPRRGFPYPFFAHSTGSKAPALLSTRQEGMRQLPLH